MLYFMKLRVKYMAAEQIHSNFLTDSAMKIVCWFLLVVTFC